MSKKIGLACAAFVVTIGIVVLVARPTLWGPEKPPNPAPAAPGGGSNPTATQAPASFVTAHWPVPAMDAREQMGKFARENEAGVFLVGRLNGGAGTAWVVSKKHRLLVTNAHVADVYFEKDGFDPKLGMIANPSGSTQTYRVNRIWYHPGVRRNLRGGLGSVQSVDHTVGPVSHLCPDVAVLQLAPEGPDLQVEFTIASTEELASLMARPAAVYGFPGHDTAFFPVPGSKAVATYHDGVISRSTDFHFNVNVSPARLQFVQYTMHTWPGFSGSPVFLPNGHVAAVHNSAPQHQWFAETRSVPHGIRIDCLAELLVHHKLTDLVPFTIDESRVRASLDFWLRPDDQGQQAIAAYWNAVKLTNEARGLLKEKRTAEAIAKCTEAAKLVPQLPEVFQIRSQAGWEHFVAHRQIMEKKQRIELLEAVRADLLIVDKLAPSSPATHINLSRTLTSLGQVRGDDQPIQEAIHLMNSLLGLGSNSLPNEQRANAHHARGIAFGSLKKDKAALEDLNDAINLGPNTPGFYGTRANLFLRMGRADLAAADRAKEKELRDRPPIELIPIDTNSYLIPVDTTPPAIPLIPIETKR